MTLRVAVRTTAKRGSEPHENEDSTAKNIDAGRFAVSDGAATTARADVWSRLLTDAFVNGADPLADDTLTTLRQTWQELVHGPDCQAPGLMETGLAGFQGCGDRVGHRV